MKNSGNRSAACWPLMHVLASCVIALLSSGAQADIVPLALTVSGKIHNTNESACHCFLFDKRALQSLPQAELTTSTPWTESSTFRGPRMEDVLKHVGAYGTKIDLVAYDGYVLHDVPIGDIQEFHPLLAYMSNGIYLRLRDMGPLFFVYSRDNEKDLTKRLDYTTREIRQVKAVLVK